MEEQPRDILHISKDYGQRVQAEEIARLLDIFELNTLIKDGYGIPEPGDPNYYSIDYEPLSKRDLKDKVKYLLQRGDKTYPDKVYVLSEERTDNPEGLSQYSLDGFINHVVPYIHDFGSLRNFWATDKKVVLTFHQSGILYWRKVK